MVINFPSKPTHEQVWPAKGDYRDLEETKGVIFKYDQFTNSWDIVGPDNIATTEWVLGQKKDDTTNLERAYDLVTATNDIGVEAKYKSLEYLTCDTLLDGTIRGGILHAPAGNDETIEETLEYAIPDWAKCVSDAGLGPGYLSYAGYDRDAVDPDINDGNITTTSKKYKDLEAFCLHTTDDEGNDVDWYGSVATDDTLEISFEGSGGNVEYAVYVITDISVVDTFTVSLRLRYVGASHPEENFNLTGTNTYYQLRTYTRNVTTAGATFDGPVRVKADDDEALSARRKTGNTTARTFSVNTNDHKVSASVDYNTLLGTAGYDDPELLCTYGYVIMRLGPDNVARGPYLPLTGGTLTGDFGLTVKRQSTGSNSERTFTIRGKNSSSSSGNSNLLTVKTSGGIDYLAYSSSKIQSDSLLNKQQIQDLIDGGADNTAYLPIAGGTMTGTIKGISTSDSSDGDAACSKAYADTKEYVHNGQTSDKGRLWTDGNSIYFNPY